jgi:hypothetical protein
MKSPPFLEVFTTQRGGTKSLPFCEWGYFFIDVMAGFTKNTTYDTL